MDANAGSTISHEVVTVNNIRLHVSTAGHRGAPLIMFLHGFPESALSWQTYLREMSGTYFAIAPDNRGFYRSEKPEAIDAYRMDNIVADIAGLATHYGATKFILVGHDWGGIAAWYFAARYPSRLRQLIILNAPHPTIFQHAIFTDAAQRAASQYVTRFRDTIFEAHLQSIGLAQFWMMLFGAQLAAGYISVADKDATLKAWANPGAMTAMLNWYRAAEYVVPSDTAPLLTAAEAALASPVSALHIAVDTCVIWGMQDKILLPCLLDDLHRYVPKLHLLKIEDTGHGVIHERRDMVLSMIKKMAWKRPYLGHLQAIFRLNFD